MTPVLVEAKTCKLAESRCRRSPAQRLRFRVSAGGTNGSNGSSAHVVPPAWPGRAVIDPAFQPTPKAKVRDWWPFL